MCIRCIPEELYVMAFVIHSHSERTQVNRVSSCQPGVDAVKLSIQVRCRQGLVGDPGLGSGNCSHSLPLSVSH